MSCQSCDRCTMCGLYVPDLVEELEYLREVVKAGREVRADLEETIRIQFKNALAEVTRLEAALRKYGQHTKQCAQAAYHESVNCYCGLDDALSGGESKVNK